MITLEIAFETDAEDFRVAAPGIGFEIDSSMKSDRLPSLWEGKIFSRFSGRVIHIFDRMFVGKGGYRALYDDLIDDRDRIKFKPSKENSFIHLIDASLKASREQRIYVCSDMQFGPAPKRYKAMSRRNFLSHYQRFGLRINSCCEVVG